jgi:hypothetical protein
LPDTVKALAIEITVPAKTYTPAEALPKIAAFCAYQERTQKEVAEKLKSYGLDEDEAGEIIIRLGREKLLDEERYAQSYARGKHRTNGWGISNPTSTRRAQRPWVLAPLMRRP